MACCAWIGMKAEDTSAIPEENRYEENSLWNEVLWV